MSLAPMLRVQQSHIDIVPGTIRCSSLGFTFSSDTESLQLIELSVGHRQGNITSEASHQTSTGKRVRARLRFSIETTPAGSARTAASTINRA